jgi:hypothetical protein
MLRLAGAAILMAFSTPAHAEDWYYVSSAKDLANISFIDKDSIRDTGNGTLHASMFSLLAQPDEEGGTAFRFDRLRDFRRRPQVAGRQYDGQ